MKGGGDQVPEKLVIISGAEASDAVLIALLLTTPLPLVGAFSQLSQPGPHQPAEQFFFLFIG